jgi:serine O-acetyltransferase
MAENMGVRLFPVRFLFIALMPSIVALTLFRISHWLHVNGFPLLAWPVWLLNQYVTGADINPTAEIGASCLIGHPIGVVITGRIGERATIYGGGGVGGGTREGDVGGGPGLPNIGDDVVLGWGACILGPVVIGDRVKIGPGAMVLSDVPADGIVLGRPAQIAKASRPSVSEAA